jgi:hypothetical protein
MNLPESFIVVIQAGSGQTRTDIVSEPGKISLTYLENVALYDIANSFLKEYDLEISKNKYQRPF